MRSGSVCVFRERGAWHDLHSDDLNEALRRLSGTDITAKDFRTWHATVLAAVAVAVTTKEARATPAARRPQIARAVRDRPVLTRLGEHGDFGCPAVQGAVEAAVLELLEG
ncbi:hypothetical protein ABZV31_12370 [Streptomyces sp. NPDC005202]|uniref:hypothetical protein n=1 Tax=Streptomyces sp. NPDC005202 TaxID=3157021 RepID=UPI0033AD2764